MHVDYDLVGSGFAGSMTVLNFLEQCARDKKQSRVALIEVGKDGEVYVASRWTMAYLRLGRNNNFDSNWIKEMELVSNGLADLDYCRKFGELVPSLVQYLIDHGVKLNHHDEKNVLLEFNTHQHFVLPEGGGNAIITAVFEHIKKFKNCDILWETEATKLLTSDKGEVIGVKVRKSDGLLYDIRGKNVMLVCGGFEGNREMLAKYVGKNTQALPLIPSIEVQPRSGH